MLYTAALILQLVLAGLLFFLLIAFITGGPFVPTNKKDGRAMVALARISPGMRVVDLGSGDGRLLFLAAKEGAHATGYEINPYLVLWSKFLAAWSGLSRRVCVKWQNLWGAQLADIDVVFVYLLPFQMHTLAKKLTSELPAGALVITNSFLFPKWKILRSDPLHHMYAYRIPAQSGKKIAKAKRKH